MIVTVSDSNGIKQYDVPDNIKKIIIVFLFVLVAVISALGYYVYTLHSKVIILEKNIKTEKVAEKKTEKKSKLVFNKIDNNLEKKHISKAKEVKKLELLLTKEDERKEALANTEKEKAKKEALINAEKVKREKLAKAKRKAFAQAEIARKIKKEELAKLERAKEVKLAKAKAKKEALAKAKLEKLEKEKKVRLAKEKLEKLKKAKQAKLEKLEKVKLAKAKKEALLKLEKNKKIKKSKVSEREKLLEKIAKNKLGKRYVWGAVGPTTFDCSGFTSYVYRKTGINIPRTSRQQSRYGKLVDRKHLKQGDLIFFDTSRRRKGIINHVGMYIGNNKFIHASSAKKRVVITKLSDFYSKRFKWARRMIN